MANVSIGTVVKRAHLEDRILSTVDCLGKLDLKKPEPSKNMKVRGKGLTSLAPNLLRKGRFQNFGKKMQRQWPLQRQKKHL